MSDELQQQLSPEVAAVDLSEPAPCDEFDADFMSLAGLYLLVESTPAISRDDLAAILRLQFGDIDFTVWPDIASFEAALRPEYSMGFKAMCLIAYLTLGIDKPISEILEIIRKTFEVPGAKDLPEFIEAELRVIAHNIASADHHTADSISQPETSHHANEPRERITW